MQLQAFPPLIAVVGPTAVGKTALAIELARQLAGEIVNADSRQIYREMDIGTAKPTPEEQRAVPHHLLDIVTPAAPFSLAVYSELAMGAVDAITQRGHVPLLVGGTGQYVAAIVEGWSIPRVAPQPEVRARLEAEAVQVGAASLHARLRELDPPAAAKIEPNNTRRIIRALEVYEITGRPISEQQAKQPPPYNITPLWLTLDRQKLYQRIDARVDAMVAAGLVDEVRGLLAGGYGWELPAMSSLGYKEFRPYFENRASLGECIERLKFNTHAFVRKQDMWFRRLPNRVQLPVDQPQLLARALAALEPKGRRDG
ncbi:MAG: tRNA (adenosine(37)-N6)-dimethylallyltransferase MiaA [Chloroflexi bacterium]|nr:MAG: tRNA (adenosine(37)-N6)-dimethylallyltransferase MiaA [Chloroflexota bacterium]